MQYSGLAVSRMLPVLVTEVLLLQMHPWNGVVASLRQMTCCGQLGPTSENTFT